MTKPALAVLVLASTVFAACGGGSPAASPTVTGPAALNATTVPMLPTSVTALPNTDVAAFHQLLAQLKGTPVVVNVWASWCTPCVAEAPLLKAAALKNPDIQFLGVDIQDSRSGATGFLISHGVPYPSLFDPAGAIRTDLGSIGQPVTAFYDAQGNQVAKVDGQIGADQLAAELAKI
jgi:thiol-disulfide isomerase/thioredoxin